MSSGGGSTTPQVTNNYTTGSSSVQLPDWAESAGETNINRANYISKLGYIPQYGVDIAGFSPMQTSAMQNTADAATAFGLQAPTDAMAGMPAMQTDNLGFTGYSSGDIYSGYLGNLANVAPAQYAAMRGMFIDPVTGDLGVSFTPQGQVVDTGAVVSAPAASLYDFGGTYKTGGNYTPTESSPSAWAAGTGNIEGGNQMGYAGNPWVQAGMGLKGIADIPILGGGLLGALGSIIGNEMIGYDTKNIAGSPTITTRGSFDPMTFSDATPTDIGGGAMGSNVARNEAGDIVSIGYGYGQIDPRIAEAAGFTIDPSYNPTPAPQVTTFQDGSRSVVSTDPATTQTKVEYFDANGNSLGSYNKSLGGLTLTQKDENGMYIVPDFRAIKAEEQKIAAETKRAAAQAAAQRAVEASLGYVSGSSGGGSTGYSYNPASSASRQSSALDSGTGSGIGSGGGNASRGYSTGGW